MLFYFPFSGNENADRILRTLLGNANLTGALLACFMDNTLPGTFFMCKQNSSPLHSCIDFACVWEAGRGFPTILEYIHVYLQQTFDQKNKRMKFFLRDKGGARNHGLAEFRDAGRRPVQCIHTGGYLIVRPSASGTRQKLVNHEVHSVFAKSQT